MTKIPVSVLMAVHNGMPYVPKAVESLLAQTHSDFEFLLIDDHSTDESRRYLDSLKDPRLRVLSNPKKGLTSALNFGLKQAQGQWIARMDADDWSFPERLSRQLEATQQPDTVLVSANYVVCDEDLQPAGEIHLCPPNPKLYSYLHKKNNPFCHPVMMFHRETALDVGGYRYERAQDYDLWIRLLQRGKLAHADEVLLKYRVRKQAISIQHVNEQSQSRKAIQKQAVDPSVNGHSGKAPHGQYAYRLGFAAWLAGNRAKAAKFLATSLIQRNNMFRSLAALLLMPLPRRWYLNLAGYKGVYKA